MPRGLRSRRSALAASTLRYFIRPGPAAAGWSIPPGVYAGQPSSPASPGMRARASDGEAALVRYVFSLGDCGCPAALSYRQAGLAMDHRKAAGG